MRVLITNDDGVDSPGIHELARQVSAAGYEVIVIAPDHDASGTGASLGRISADHPIAVKEVQINDLDVPVYAIAGPPALCVVTAYLEAFGPAPDVVVSGINAGLNTGRSALHSGTIGAALAGQNFGLRSLAVSLAGAAQWYWPTAAQVAVEVLPTVIEGPDRGALNLNVPGIPRDQVKGIRWAELAHYNAVKSAIHRVEDGHIHFHMVESGFEPHQHSDLATVQAGYAALTSLHGTAEVWAPGSLPGVHFDAALGVHGATAGHELRASKAFREAVADVLDQALSADRPSQGDS
ncbi:MAG: 5'/3'-nucleotidase SurE [Proteobacteria bacterium]|jgi:5'-nucleotidase|nr:5'/3'-nucleotidase SurE [Pseudomonadota bacterium]MDA1299351.1 5'/3'-nucleotidase SurE [Pseudomonadota bacterium]